MADTFALADAQRDALPDALPEPSRLRERRATPHVADDCRVHQLGTHTRARVHGLGRVVLLRHARACIRPLGVRDGLRQLQLRGLRRPALEHLLRSAQLLSGRGAVLPQPVAL